MESRRPLRKQQILLAALRVFARRGFQRATLREIAQEAGIGKSTIYEYFQSKTHLFQELTDFLFRNLEQATYGALPRDLPPEEKLCQTLRAFARFMVQMPYGTPEETLAIITDIFAESVRQGTVDLRPVYERERGALEALVAEGIQQGVFRPDLDPASVASLILAVLDGLLTQWLLWPGEVNLEHRIQDFCHLLRTGLHPLSPQPK